MITLPLASVASASATAWSAGVKKGDCFYYETYGVYSSDSSNFTFRIPAFEYNTTRWLRVNIDEIQGPSVYQTYTLHYKNQSETSFNFTTDLDPANEPSLKFTQKGVPICAGNLSAGDALPTVNLTINKTVTRSYPSGTRATNAVSWNYSGDWGNCFFDKETGMLVELSRTHVYIDAVTGMAIDKTDVIRLISTNRWEVSSNQQTTPTQGSPCLPILTVCLLLPFTVLILKPTLLKAAYRLKVRGITN